MIGDSVPAGKRDSTVPTFSRTSLAASCTLRSSTKVAKTCDWPSMVEERSSSRPLMVLTTSSIGLVIWLSISSGEAPGKRVVMVMVGRSTLGKMSTPSWTKEASPSTTRVAMTMVVKTGRRTKTSRKPTYLAALASIRVTGAPLKSWERFETATVSPGFTPRRSPPTRPGGPRP